MPCACLMMQAEHSALALPGFMPGVHPLQDTLHKHSPDFGTAVLQDKVHLGKCKPSPCDNQPREQGCVPSGAFPAPHCPGCAMGWQCQVLQMLPEPGKAKMGMSSWMMGLGSFITLCWRD